MNNLLIRPATPADFPVILGFVSALEEQVFDALQLQQVFEQCLSGQYAHYFLALVADEPAGYISCHGQHLLHHGGLVYEIQELYVDPAYRSMGIGRQLLLAVERAIAGQPYVSLELCSNMRRTDAHRFYTNNGYEPTSYKFAKRLLEA